MSDGVVVKRLQTNSVSHYNTNAVSLSSTTILIFYFRYFFFLKHALSNSGLKA